MPSPARALLSVHAEAGHKTADWLSLSFLRAALLCLRYSASEILIKSIKGLMSALPCPLPLRAASAASLQNTNEGKLSSVAQR